MIRIRRKPLLAAFALVALIGASFTATALDDTCNAAYKFCWPRYYTCLDAGNPQPECHLELDACLLRNGCGALP